MPCGPAGRQENRNLIVPDFFFAALWIFRFRHNQKEPLAAAQEKKTVNRYDDLTGRLREMIYHFVRHFVQR